MLLINSIYDLTDGSHDGVPDNIEIPTVLSMVGLVLNVLGTGGIEMCVTAFGGDQYEDHQEKQRSRFFSIFCRPLNAGGLISTRITSILRCKEWNSCQTEVLTTNVLFLLHSWQLHCLCS